MKLTIRQLRRIIRESGLDTDMLNAALMSKGGGEPPKPPPGLGDTEEQTKDNSDYNEQETAQAGVRVDGRAGHAGR